MITKFYPNTHTRVKILYYSPGDKSFVTPSKEEQNQQLEVLL